MPWITAGASLLGGLFGSEAASDAAATQAQATREANDLQRYIYENNVRLNQPAIDAGNLGRNRLMQLLGLGGTPGGQTQTREQLRQSLAGRFTTPGVQTYVPPRTLSSNPNYDDVMSEPSFTSGAPTVDEAGLQAAIEAEMARTGVDSSSPEYGSLLKAFTGADLQNEPGYQFGMAEGQKGIDRRAAAGGGYFSGAALKAAQRFGQDYAGTKFNEAFNRDTTSKNNIYNRLQGIVSPGQVATNNVGTMGQNYAGSVGSNLTGNANAQGAAGIAGANAWQDAINSGVNAFTQNNAQNSLLRNLRRYGTTGGADTMGFGGEY